jgi:ABC-type branched-subunit amino acid transport system substrate-binding protein
VRPANQPPSRGAAGLRTGARARLAGLIAVAAAALVAAGCSSASTSSTSASAPASSAPVSQPASSAAASASAAPTGTVPANDTGITATTIKVGMIADVNTQLAPGLFQLSVNAMNAWAKEVNAAGGLDGRQVVVDFCDSKLDPNASTSCVIKACQNDFALVGTSADALVDLSDIDGCKNAAGKTGLPDLAAFAFPPLSCDPDTYLVAGLGTYCATAKENPQTYTVPVGDSRYLTAQNKDLHGLWLYDGDVPTFKLTQTPVFQAESNLGIKKDGQGFYAVSGAAPQSALTPYIQQIKSSGSTFVYDDVTPQSMVLLRREAQLQGVNSVKVWMCNSGCYDPSFVQQGGSAVNGTYASLLDLPYLTDYKVNPALTSLVNDLGGLTKVNNNAINSYIMGILFQDAVNKVVASGQPLDRQSLFTALNDEHSFNAAGIIGATDVGTHTPSNCQVLVQLQNGTWNRVYPTTPGTFDCNTANKATLKMSVS